MTGVWRSHWTRAVCVACALAALHTWPLASAPGSLSRNDNGDALLNEWIVAWVQHQFVTDPAELFQANIFYPARDTLAYSEPLIVPAVMGAPVRAAGGSPVLVHNLLLLAGLALSMLAMYALVSRWTGDHLAALLSGSAFAFNAHILTRLAHLQAMHAYGLPLALLVADRLVTHRRIRDAIWLAVWMTVSAYNSGHFVIFSCVIVGIALLVRMREWIRAPITVLSRFALAAVMTVAAVLPVYLPYRRVATEQAMVRSLDHVTEFSVTLWSYLASPSRMHQALWSARWFPSIDSYFPGVVVLALSICAVLFVTTRPRVYMLGAIAIAGIVLSLGTHTPIYGWMYVAFPPMSAIRAASRFGILFLFATAALAGFGLWTVRARWLRGTLSGAVGIAAIALVNVEALRAPLAFRAFQGIPALYALLRQEPGHVVLAEQPFYRPDVVFMNAEYVLNSTAHWRPLMNGYSGHTPRSYVDVAREFALFPAPSAIDAMRRAGVTHVMVHPARFTHGDAVMKLCGASPSLERLGSGRHGMTLYRLK